MPADPVRWIQRVRKGRIKPVRIGKANGHIFLTVAGIGFDSKVVDSVSSLKSAFCLLLPMLCKAASWCARSFC